MLSPQDPAMTGSAGAAPPVRPPRPSRPARLGRGLIRATGRIGRFAVRLVRAGAVVAVLSVTFFVAATAVSFFYDQYGFHPEKNARAWARLTPSYADSILCQKCHAPEYARLAASKHVAIACESCHGPLGTHAATGLLTAAEANGKTKLCVTCHEAVVGRPAAFPQHEASVHYGPAPCLQCHGAHSTDAARPVRVSHPLTNLPSCAVCHGPKGMRPAPPNHAQSTDTVCLGCHAPDLRDHVSGGIDERPARG